MQTNESKITAPVGDTWYRFQDTLYAAPLDEFDNPCGTPRMSVECHEYKVKKVTDKGVWLGYSLGDMKPFRHVLFDSQKKFANPSKEEALTSFIARKERQSGILSAQLKRAQNAASTGWALLGQSLTQASEPEPVESDLPAPSM